MEEKSKTEGKRLFEGAERGNRGEKQQPVEIIGVEDITQQIAVQMEGREGGGREGERGVRDTVIEVGPKSYSKSSIFVFVHFLYC